MENNSNRSFLLDNCLAAVSAIPFSQCTYATDGHNCCIHIINNNGCDNCCRPTFRAYRKMRLNPAAGQVTALGQCSGRRIYLLSEDFCEKGYIDLNTSRQNGCGCGNSSGQLEDASLVCIGSEIFIVGAFSDSVYLFDSDGKKVSRLCNAENHESITDFIYPKSELFALATLCGRNQTVTISDNGILHSAILQGCYTLRMLFSEGDDIYGLFGQNYIYNKIYKIYSNGVLTLPRGDSLGNCC